MGDQGLLLGMSMGFRKADHMGVEAVRRDVAKDPEVLDMVRHFHQELALPPRPPQRRVETLEATLVLVEVAGKLQAPLDPGKLWAPVLALELCWLTVLDRLFRSIWKLAKCSILSNFCGQNRFQWFSVF